MNAQNIINILENLDLTKRQAKIYLACLKHGPIGVSQLVKDSGEKQTTVFDNVNKLISKGLITASQKGKRRLLVAEKPGKVENTYKKKLNDFRHIVPFLDALAVKEASKPIVRYYEGRKGVKQIFEEALSCKDKFSCYMGSMKVTKSVLGNRYHKNWISRRIKRGIQAKALRIKADEIKDDYYSKQKGYLREIRYMSQDILVGCNLAIYDDKVTFISGLQQGFGFVVESQEFSQMMKNMFMAFWEMSQPAEEA